MNAYCVNSVETVGRIYTHKARAHTCTQAHVHRLRYLELFLL